MYVTVSQDKLTSNKSHFHVINYSYISWKRQVHHWPALPGLLNELLKKVTLKHAKWLVCSYGFCSDTVSWLGTFTSQILQTKNRRTDIRGIFKKINLFILFIYFWLRWVFVAARVLSLVAVSGGYSSLWHADFSLWWLLLLQSMGSRRAGFSSCGTWAQ